ncbi:MAG TPA: hypothetical protein VG248_13025 [Caulobacteraceae bacterium]|jgi:hypothetical protein|nr:hypothetical protein [Caulobacteraceae bacterium]
MVATTVGAYQRFEIGRVIERVVTVFKRNPVPLLLAGLLLSALPRALVGVLSMAQGVTFDPGSIAMRGLIGFAGAIITLVGGILLQPALLFGVVSDCAGGRPTLGQMMRVAVRTALPVLAVGILVGIAVGIGFVLLIVPGVFLALMLCVAAPARVVEGEGVMRAINRSMELTRGHRWAILGFFLIYAVLSLLVMLVVGLVIMAVGAGSGGLFGYLTARAGTIGWAVWPVALVIAPLVQALTTTVGAAAIASVYYELRTLKDGIGADALAQAFD